MKELVWDNTLSVQVNEIDDDHRKLLDLFNMLNHAVTNKEPEKYIGAVLEELICCTAWHFSHEERLMVKYNYEDLDSHKEEHHNLIESARDMQKKFIQKGYQISSEEIEFLERWLTGHILGSDMELGEFLGEVI